MMLMSDTVAVSLISATASFAAALLSMVNSLLLKRSGIAIKETRQHVEDTKEHVAALAESSAATRDYIEAVERSAARLVFLAGDTQWAARHEQSMEALKHRLEETKAVREAGGDAG